MAMIMSVMSWLESWLMRCCSDRNWELTVFIKCEKPTSMFIGVGFFCLINLEVDCAEV